MSAVRRAIGPLQAICKFLQATANQTKRDSVAWCLCSLSEVGGHHSVRRCQSPSELSSATNGGISWLAGLSQGRASAISGGQWRAVYQQKSAISSATTVEMINEEDFLSMVAEMAAYDAEREKVIKQSRDIQKNAKQAIFSLHRGAFGKAQQQLVACEEVAQSLSDILKQNPDLKYGSFSNSMEEYAEARVFKTFLEEGRLLGHSELSQLTRDEYLGGVLDFTGELNRYCIAKATVRDMAEVRRCRDLVDGLMALFLQFDFRNGSLRKKFDSLKYTLKKMENTLYELSLTEAGFGKSQAVDRDDPPPTGQGGEHDADA